MHEPALLLFDQVGGSELFCAWWAAKKMGASAEQLCLKSRVSNHLSGWAGGNTSESTFTSLFKVGLVLRADSCCCFSCSFCYLWDFAPSAQH